MSCSSKADIFSALVNGDLDFLKGLHSDVDLNEYITLDTPARRCCNCHVEFELFTGSAEEMLATYGDAVATGECDHCDGRSKASGNSQGIPNSGFFQYFHSMVTNNETDGGLNALQLAVHFGHKTIVEWLISARGGSIQSVTKHMRETPLNIAAIHGNVDMVQFLLENGAQINCYSELVNESPAQYATIFNHPDLLEFLIEHGADINHEGNMYENPLETAFAAENIRCTELLLKAGVDAIGSKGGSMFRIGLEQDNRELARLFLDYINVNDQLIDEGDVKYTPLLVAVRLDDAEMVRLLIEKGANLEADVGGQHTVLNYAVYQDMFEMTKVLVEFGCSVNHVNDVKYSPLHFAAWDGSHEICEVLLAHGAEYDVQTSDKNTPLALACHGNYLSVIELLLPLNCKVNNQDKDMDSPLLYTTFNGNVKATHLLLEHGADPQMANNLGTTPIWNAIYARNAELVHCFIECNVDLDGVSVGIDQHAQQMDVSKIYSEPKSLLYVACDRLVANVPTWLVLAGLDLTKETWLYKDMLPRSLTVTESPEIKAICDELYHLTHNVRSLKQTCRVYIRRLLKRHLSRDIGKLGLPSLLQYYLSCKGFKHSV